MTLLSRYLITEQLTLLLLSLGALTGIHLAINVLDKLRTFLSHDAGIGVMLQYFALGLPAMINEVLPFALLIATVLSLGMLSARSEITAMRAAGVGLFKLISPLLGVGLLLSVMSAWSAMGFIPHTSALADQMFNTMTGRATGGAVFSSDRIWFRAEGSLFGIRSAELAERRMDGIRILTTAPDGAVTRLITADAMVFEQDRWQLLDGRVTATAGGTLSVTAFERRPAPLSRSPEQLADVSVRKVTLAHSALADYIQRLKDDGYNATPFEVEMARRLAFPFSSLIMVLVAIPFGLTPPRSHSLAKGLGVSLTIALMFWLLYSLATALGRASMLAPAAAAWLPVAVFAAYGVYRLLAVRQ